jgi:N-ethylmaleimide reductase
MLFDPFVLRNVPLANRLVMSPLTRSRAVHNNTANALMATYSAQRAGAGLIITEGTSPSPNGLGYARIPGLFNSAQVAGWKMVTEAVHAKGGRIVVQLMHTGRVSHQANMPAGAMVLGPSASPCPGDMWTDAQGSQPHTTPREMTPDDIAAAVGEFVQAARMAMEAGFDGVELHAANGYLLEQFLNANINRRGDGYGGTPQGRNRLALEVAAATAQAIGSDRVGIRLSPYGVFNGAGAFPEVDAQYLDLVKGLSDIGLMYAHVLDHSALGAPAVPDHLKSGLREAFRGPFILAGGFNRDQAEQALASGRADLIAMGRPFLANPDLVERLRRGSQLNAPDPQTFYTPGEKGYTDYPALQA